MSRFDDINEKIGLFGQRVRDIKRAREERLEIGTSKMSQVDAAISDIEKKMEEIGTNPNLGLEERLEKLTKEYTPRLDALRSLRQRLDVNLQETAAQQFKRSLQAQFNPRSIREGIASVSRSIDTFAPSLQKAEGLSTYEIEDSLKRAKSLMGRQQSRIMETVHDADDPNSLPKLEQQVKIYDKLVEQVAGYESAIGAQKKTGQHAAQKYYSARNFAARVEQNRDTENITQGVARGQFGSQQDVQLKISETGDKLIQTFKQLEEATIALSKISSEDAEQRKKAIEVTKNLNKEYDRLQSEYRQHTSVLGEMRRQGVGADDMRGAGLRRAGNALSTAGTAGQYLSSAFLFGEVDVDLTRVAQRTQFTDVANRRYNDFLMAGRGDVAARSRIIDESYETQIESARDLANKRGLGEKGGVASKLLAASGEGLSAFAENTAEMAPAGAAGGKAGLLTILGLAGMRALPQASEAYRGYEMLDAQIPQTQTFLERYDTIEKLKDAMSYQRNTNVQAAEDQFKSMNLAARGFGVGGVQSSFLSTAVNPLGPQGYLPYDASTIEGITGVSDDTSGPPRRIRDSRGRLIPGRQASSDKTTAVTTSVERPDVEMVQEPGTERVSRAEAVMRAFYSPEAKNILGLEGIDDSRGDISRMLSGFRQSVGASFADQGVEGMRKDVLSARRATVKGLVGSEEEYISMRGQLAEAGGTRTDLEKVLETAVRLGLDGSKFSGAFVSSIQSLSEQVSVSSGISTIAGATLSAGSAVSALRDMGVSRELRGKAGAAAARFADEASSSQQLDIFNLMETSRIGAISGVEDPLTIAGLKGLSQSQVNTMRTLREKMAEGGAEGKAAGEDYEKFAKLKGLDKFFLEGEDEEIDQRLKELYEAKAKTIIGRATGGGLTEDDNAAIEKLLERQMTPSEFRKEFPETARRMALSVGARDAAPGLSMDSVVGAATGVSGKTVEQGGTGDLFSPSRQAGTLMGAGADFDVAGAITAAKQFQDGALAIAGAVGGFQEAARMNLEVAKIFDPAKLNKAAQDAAGGNKLDVSVNDLSEQLNIFSKTVGRFNTNFTQAIDKLETIVPLLPQGIK